jgi:hypothetical protein
MTVTKVLPRTLSLLTRLLERNHSTRMLSEPADDPLAINLPPMGPGGVGAAVDQATLEAMAALYFQAELEQAAVIPVAEVLADSRFTLEVRDPQTAGQLEDFANNMQGNWYSRELREQLFARTFGYSGSVTGHHSAINREFEPLFGQFCLSLQRHQQRARWAPPGGGTVARVEMALQNLLRSLARRRLGNTLIAARRIQGQLQAAINLLNQPDLTRLFQAQNLWGLIGNILGPDSPDLARHIERAQNGLRLLSWLARHHSDLSGTALAQRLQSESRLFLWAANWLQASGYEDAAPQHPDQQQPYPSGYGTRAAGGS